MVWQNYCSEGEECSRIYPLKFDEATNSWILDPAVSPSTGYTDFDFKNAYTQLEMGPTVFDESFEEIQVVDNPRVDGEVYKRSAGFRYHLSIEWKAVELDERASLVGLVNIGKDIRFRVYPHRDNTMTYFDCIIVNHNMIQHHMVENLYYPPYSPTIEFLGAEILEFFPHFWSNYHFFFQAKGSFGAYTNTEKLRLCNFRSKTLWNTYLTTDYSGQFSKKTLK